MIFPDGFRGAAFGTVGDGDAKRHAAVRKKIAAELGLSSEWSFVRQVHGSTVLEADAPGVIGEADAMFTTHPEQPLAIATADCLPIVVEGDGVVATVHAGWRGLASGVVEETLSALASRGLRVDRAAIGPGIGPCCYEVGEEVARHFDDHRGVTTWGTTSVDLAGAAATRLRGLEVWRARPCTMCGSGFNSFRRDGTDERQVAVGWLPRD